MPAHGKNALVGVIAAIVFLVLLGSCFVVGAKLATDLTPFMTGVWIGAFVMCAAATAYTGFLSVVSFTGGGLFKA